MLYNMKGDKLLKKETQNRSLNLAHSSYVGMASPATVVGAPQALA